MNIKDYVKTFNLPFEKLKNDFKVDFDSLFLEEKEGLGNLDNKIQLLKNEKNENAIKDVIQKLKLNESFSENDTSILSTFISKINTVLRIANRINNYKEGTPLDKGEKLKLYAFFNAATTSNNLKDFGYNLNDNLKNFLPHIYSVIKHFQSPNEFPFYYKYRKNILREVLSQDDDYDSMCAFYRTFPLPDRHLNFATYLGVIGLRIAKNVKNSGLNLSKESRDYKYLINDVINIDRYNSILDNQLSSNKNIVTNSKQYWLYAPGENARNWEEFYNIGIMGLGWDKIGNLRNYKSRDEIKQALVEAYGGEGSKKNDVSANDDFLNKVKIGDIIIAKKGRGELLGYGVIISDYEYDKERTEYHHIRKVDWKLNGRWKVDFSLVLKTLTDITKYSSNHPDYGTYFEMLLGIMGQGKYQNDYREEFTKWLNSKYGENSGTIASYIKAIDILSQILSKELFKTIDEKYLETLYKDLIKEQGNPDGKYYHQDAPSYGNNGFYSASIKSYRDFLKIRQSISKNGEEQMSFPLNTILYGPPGTGKTYYTVLRAAEIIENRKIESYDEALQIFKANLHDRIEFITFHQNYSYEDFIQGLRPDIENNKELTFERKDGVFKIIADKALKNILESDQPRFAKKQFEEVFNQFINPFIEGEVEEIEVKMKKVSFFITSISNKSIDFRKASGGTSHTLSIATLKKMYEAESLLDFQGLTSYYTPLLTELLKIGIDSKGRKAEVKRKNFVLVIDEINRANISRVFGELITLIESDKRSHGAIPMEARLPSGDQFVVPSNLYIVGTMNTADKSIALLDIALRRRFEFESMYPVYDIHGHEIYDKDILKKINEQIIKSKGHDFQIGHAYFMVENEDLIDRMNKKVIPLLLEYYMNDEKEVKGILLAAGLKIEENSWPLRIIGKND